MKKFLPKSGLLTFVFLITNLFFASGVFAQATVYSDKDDYSPGEYVLVQGSGWLPGETVSFHFDEDPQPATCLLSHDLTAVADLNGDIYNKEFLVKINHLGVAFVLTATGQTSERVAITEFTDGSLSVSPGTACGIGTTAIFTLTTSGLDTTKEMKLYKGTVLTGTLVHTFSSTNLTYTISNVQLSNAGSYYYIASKSNGTAENGAANFYANVISNNTISANQTICSGSSASDLIGTTSTVSIGDVSYRWYSSTDGVNFSPINGTSGNNSNYSPGVLTAAIWYKRVVSSKGTNSGNCSIDSNVIKITVIAGTENLGTVAGSETVCAGSLGVGYSVQNSPNISSFNWSVPSGAIIASGSGTNAITVDFGSTAGNVSVTGTNICGTNTPAIIKAVTINPLPTTVTVAAAGTFCNSTTITASNGSSGTIYFQGTTSGGTSTATASSSQTITTSGTYYFRAQSVAGCWGAEGSVAVTINPLPTAVAVGGGGTFCNSTIIAASNGSSGTIYFQGTTSGGTSTATASSSQTITTSGTYYFRAQSVAGCWGAEGSVAVTINPLPTAVAVGGAGTFCNSTIIAASNGSSGTIYFQGTTSGGTSTATVSSSQTITSSRTYYFRARSVAGCWGVEGSAIVTINPNPTFTTSSTNVNCYGNGNGEIKITTSASSPMFSMDNGANYTSGTSPFTFSGLSLTTYQVKVKSGTCESETASVTITEPALLTANAVETTAVVCYGESNGVATVTPAGGNGGYTYLWSDGQITAAATGLAAGNYTVTVTDSKGCEIKTDPVTITEPALLTAMITPVKKYVYFGAPGDQTATITATPSGGTAPYTFKITMQTDATAPVAFAAQRLDGRLICDFMTAAGDEVWTPGTNTSSSTGILCGTDSFTASSTSIPVYGSYSVNVTLLANAKFIATVTDANGCSYVIPYSQAAYVVAEDARCFAGKSSNVKVKMCHQTGSPKNPCIEICVDESAVASHLAHGDFLGKCSDNCKDPKLVARPVVKGKEEIIEIADFNVLAYPNPSNYQFNLNVIGGSDEPVEVVVYDMLARMVKRIAKPNAKDIQFGEELPSGEYLLLVRQGENQKAINVIKK
jgi:hypothetical protein